MNKLLVSMLALAIGSFSVGCGSECSDLEDSCDSCADANIKAACKVVVDADDEDACEAANDVYNCG